MATCSSIAEPVLVFQLPDIDVLLEGKSTQYNTDFCFLVSIKVQALQVHWYIHVGFVVWADLLDPDVVLGVDERLCGGVRLGESHDAGYVLELGVILYLHLDETRQEEECETELREIAEIVVSHFTLEETLLYLLKLTVHLFNTSRGPNKRKNHLKNARRKVCKSYLSNPRMSVTNLHNNRERWHADLNKRKHRVVVLDSIWNGLWKQQKVSRDVCVPSPCSWGRKSAQSAGTSQHPASCGCW